MGIVFGASFFATQSRSQFGTPGNLRSIRVNIVTCKEKDNNERQYKKKKKKQTTAPVFTVSHSQQSIHNGPYKVMHLQG